jgi:hypothetical protein
MEPRHLAECTHKVSMEPHHLAECTHKVSMESYHMAECINKGNKGRCHHTQVSISTNTHIRIRCIRLLATLVSLETLRPPPMVDTRR